MDNIIELILNNIVFVIIAIGGILSFFKRMGNEDQNQNQRQNERPRRQASGPDSRPPQQKKEASDEIQSENVSAYQEALERISERENAQNEIKVQKPKRSSDKKKGISINKRNVRNGIVWAEILGPPRSKKPHPSITSMKQMKR